MEVRNFLAAVDAVRFDPDANEELKEKAVALFPSLRALVSLMEESGLLVDA